jgi:hypothetical protein
MLYDRHHSGPVVIPCEGLTPEDLATFCKEMGFDFFGVGHPEDWGNKEVFRVASQELPARGYDVKFAKVLEWKAAKAAIGPQVFEGGSYRHYKGGMYTTLCEAKVEATGERVVVYRGSDGAVWTRPTDEFFGVANNGGTLVARFAYCS